MVVGSVRWKRAQRRRKKRNADEPIQAVVAVVKPEGMPPGQSSVWDMLAPHAVSAKTLTPATVWAFVDLCEAIMLKRDMLAVIQADGLTTIAIKTRMEQDGSGDQIGEPKAHPLLSRHAALMVRVEAGLARFRLSPMGRPLESDAKPADPFAEFEATA